MTNTRRQFLQSSLAAIGLSLTSSAFAGPGSAAMLGSSPGSCLKLQGVVFEPSSKQSETFAATAERLGLPAYGIASDITPVWAQLVEMWRSHPAAIGGLTTQIPLLLLEQSARDYGMRVVLRAEHRPDADGVVTHLLSGPPEVSSAFKSAVRHEPNFGACIASAISQCPEETAARNTISLQTRAIPGLAGEISLYSWILAPRRPAQTREA